MTAYSTTMMFINFNSIKVRLKPAVKEANNKTLAFQFHKGTIKTVKDASEKQKLHEFQFHKGTIKTSTNICIINRYKISIP